MVTADGRDGQLQRVEPLVTVSDRILTVDDVADLVQVSNKTVMRAIAAGHLEASQLTQSRGGWRIRESAIDAWLQQRSNRLRTPRPMPDVRRVDPDPPLVVQRRRPAGDGRLVA